MHVCIDSSSASRGFSADTQTGFVFSVLIVSTGIVRGHIMLNVPPKIDDMKHVTTTDHDDLGLQGLSGRCLRHILPWCMQ